MKLRTFLLFSGACTLVACGGGGSGSSSASVEGLSLPSDLEVVSVDEGTASSPGVGGDGVVDTFDDGADYFQDQSRAHVWDRSLEPLQMISQILGMIEQTRAEEFVNEGAYLALVDESKESVGEGSSSPGSEGQSSAGNATELNPWTVLSTRKNAKKPQITRVWVPQLEDGQAAGGGAGGGPGGASEPTIFAKAEVREGATALNPYGSFDLNYAMKASTERSSQTMERGILRSVDTVPGYRGFGHSQASSMEDRSSRVEVRVSDDESSGLGRVIVTEPDWAGGHPENTVTTEFHIAYDADHFVRRVDGGAHETFERDEYDINTWQYALYHAAGPNAGDRVGLTGGFPLQKNGYHGWADYWGIWTEPGMDLEDGDTVIGFHPTEGEQNYTAIVAPGRLMRVARQAIELADMDLVTFQYWTWDEILQVSTMNMVEYRHDAGPGYGTFWIIATFDEEGGEWSGLGDPGDDVQLNLNMGEWISFWSESLGGNVDYIYGDTEMSVKKHSFVSGEDLFEGGNSLTLYGVVECLKAGITEQQANTGDIFLNDGNPGDLNDPYTYVFQKSDRALYYDDGVALGRVGLVEGAEPSGGFYDWGMMSGPLVTDAAALALLSSPWDVWQLDEYYMYETGHNEWNQYRALERQGVPVTFDPPISFLYTHETANDANESADHDGETVLLQYGGFGNLWGIPYVEDESTGRWYPKFSIASGTVVGPDGEYVIKAIESELFLRSAAGAPSQALLDALDLAGSLTPPSMSEWKNPADMSKPTVTDAPRVVAGEIQ